MRIAAAGGERREEGEAHAAIIRAAAIGGRNYARAVVGGTGSVTGTAFGSDCRGPSTWFEILAFEGLVLEERGDEVVEPGHGGPQYSVAASSRASVSSLRASVSIAWIVASLVPPSAMRAPRNGWVSLTSKCTGPSVFAHAEVRDHVRREPHRFLEIVFGARGASPRTVRSDA